MSGILAAPRAGDGCLGAPVARGGRRRWILWVGLWMMIGTGGCTGQDADEPERPPVAWAAGGAAAGPAVTPEEESVPAVAMPDEAPPANENAAQHSESAAPTPEALPSNVPATSPEPATRAPQQPWERVTAEDIERDVYFQHLPPDAGLVAPIARLSDRHDTFVVEHLDCIEAMLGDWDPAHHADPVQRVRNLLYVAAAPDMLQMQQIESVVPLVVFDWMEREIPPAHLPGLLYWVALHPYDGDDSAAGQLHGACLEIDPPEDRELLRYRAGMYAAKLLGRVTGRIPVR